MLVRLKAYRNRDNPKELGKMLQSYHEGERLAAARQLRDNPRALEYTIRHTLFSDVQAVALGMLSLEEQTRVLKDMFKERREKGWGPGAYRAPYHQEVSALARIMRKTRDPETIEIVALYGEYSEAMNEPLEAIRLLSNVKMLRQIGSNDSAWLEIRGAARERLKELGAYEEPESAFVQGLREHF